MVPRATINDSGVELPNGWAQIVVPWGELEEPEIVNGICRRRRVGKSMPIVSISTFRMNFFPGLEIVRSLLRRLPLIASPRSHVRRRDALPDVSRRRVSEGSQCPHIQSCRVRKAPRNEALVQLNRSILPELFNRHDAFYRF